MTALKTEESCVENKQSVTASGSSISEGSNGLSRSSPAASSPVTSSPSHRRTSGPIRRAKGGWTPEEDETLRRAVELHKGRSWKKIAESIPDRTEVQCLHRWQKVLNPNLVKGPWTQEEDDIIVKLVDKYGPTKWSVIAKSLPGRIGKQCRERWHNHLNPEIRKDAWTPDEEMELMKAHMKYGNKWAEIAKVLPGRTDNSIKNHWNSSLKKKSEFYLKTGKLPPVNIPVNKPVVPIAAKDAANSSTRQFIYCSNKVLDANAKTISETFFTPTLPTDPCEVDEKKDWMVAIPVQVSDSHASVEPVRGSDNSDAPECQASTDMLHHRSDSRLKLEDRSFTTAVHQIEEPLGTIAGSPPDKYGSLCYKPPQLEDLGVFSSSSVLLEHSSTQPMFTPGIFSSPISCLTPSFVNVASSMERSVESILKSAARSYPNTPSIIKRKRELHTPLPPDTMQTSETRIEDSCTSNEGMVDRSTKGSGFSASKLFSSSSFVSGLPLDNAKVYNVSPPYRLRTRRKATFRSVEKQLDFTSEKVHIDGNSNSTCLVVNRNSCSPRNVNVLSMQGMKLNDSPTECDENNFSLTAELGVT
ncbi:Myb-related protein 3R-1 [Apostasia shenzhenica]|uniref:Myb-related protein 3R-1 n=1 Tax=Apostasia shenzhenica TaxID=1088818 RepID=A0A2I0A8S8_9ASPA|nr:Myb-related protein 3R-1 [Apostasia shenzhenica]